LLNNQDVLEIAASQLDSDISRPTPTMNNPKGKFNVSTNPMLKAP